jgi:4-hydroxy-3-polyprenylbenzoate decarboxylase
MGYKSTKECVIDLEKSGQLVRITREMDPDLEMAEVQRRVYAAGGPAILFENVKGSPFPAVSNLFGTMDRCRYIFRDSLRAVQKVVQLKADPASALKAPHRFMSAPFTAIHALPMRGFRHPVLAAKTTIGKLPQIKSWPMDGGAYITLPQVCTEEPGKPGPMKANVGMYRIQLSGNELIPDKQLALHYQIHRGIGVHHSMAGQKGEKLRVSIFVGGPPAHSFGAVMPLPEGLSELMFAGMFANRRFRYTRKNGFLIASEADFVITGTIDPTTTTAEGPFGDHLGYYSLKHPFPLMEVEAVYHRKDAIWPFTVVGRPPQEDTSFGGLIHEVTEPMVPVSVPGLHAMHAVDAAGVHPLLLAIGSERYVPYGERRPQELLTVANAVLGFGQASLAKYLLIAAKEDDPSLDLHDIPRFLMHMLERVDLERDLHFQTRSTMDTLDYSGTGLNEGSKVVIAAAGKVKRSLSASFHTELKWPDGFANPRVALPGVLVVEGTPCHERKEWEARAESLADFLDQTTGWEGFPLVVIVDDSAFAAASLNNFLWVCFTRSNPSHDIHGAGSFIQHKHWGCKGPLVIDARIKPHHAPPLVEDPAISRRVDALGVKGGPLHGII